MRRTRRTDSRPLSWGAIVPLAVALAVALVLGRSESRAEQAVDNQGVDTRDVASGSGLGTDPGGGGGDAAGGGSLTSSDGGVRPDPGSQDPPAPDCASTVLLTGIDDDGNGLDDNWWVSRPADPRTGAQGSSVRPHVVAENATPKEWRGWPNDPQQGPFLSTEPHPVLGRGRWIDGGGGLDSTTGAPLPDIEGEYVFIRRFDLAGRSSFVLISEWAADDAVVEITLNGRRVFQGCSSCAHTYIDNTNGGEVQPRDGGLSPNHQHIHRLEIADQTLFNFTVDPQTQQAINDVRFRVHNAASTPVGLLVTSGPGTSVPEDGCDPAVPVHHDGIRNWADTLDLAAQARIAQGRLTESYAVIDLSQPGHKELLAEVLKDAGATLCTSAPRGGSPHCLDPLQLQERFLLLYQGRSEGACAWFAAIEQAAGPNLMQTGVIQSQAPVRLVDADGGEIGRATRLARLAADNAALALGGDTRYDGAVLSYDPGAAP